MERVTNDLKYKSQNEDNELGQAKQMFEGERRKSMGIEQAAAHLQKDHQRLADEVDRLQNEVREAESILKDLSDKYNEANRVMDELEEENNELKV